LQEAAAAEIARQRLVGPAPSQPAAAPSNPVAKPSGGSPEQPGVAVAKEKKPRIVITLMLRDAVGNEAAAFAAGTFVPTPKVGWWGAGYFVSVGALEGLAAKEAEAAEAERASHGRGRPVGLQQQQQQQEGGDAGGSVKCAKGFSEDDQASLYLKVRKGRRETGLGWRNAAAF
jgi:hypothetical protein